MILIAIIILTTLCFITNMDSINELSRPKASNFICNYVIQENNKNILYKVIELSLKTFEREEVPKNPILYFKMKDIATNNFHLGIHNENDVINKIIHYETNTFTLGLNPKTKYNNLLKLYEKGKKKISNDYTISFIYDFIERLNYNEFENGNPKMDIFFIPLKQGIIYIFNDILNNILKDKLSSIIHKTLYTKVQISTVINTLKEEINGIYIEYSNFIENIILNLNGEVYSIEMLNRNNFITNFRNYINKLDTLSNPKMIEKKEDILKHIRERFNKIEHEQINKFKKDTKYVLETYIHYFEDILHLTNNNKNNNDTYETQQFIDTIKRIFNSKRTEIRQLIKEYIIKQFDNKWTKFNKLKFDIFSMENHNKKSFINAPIFYINVSSDAVKLYDNYTIKYNGKENISFGVFVFNVDGLSILIPQPASGIKKVKRCVCYFTGYSYKGHTTNDYHLLISNSAYNNYVYNFLDYWDTKLNNDKPFKHYLTYKNVIHSDNNTDYDTIKSNALVTKNMGKLEGLNRSFDDYLVTLNTNYKKKNPGFFK